MRRQSQRLSQEAFPLSAGLVRYLIVPVGALMLALATIAAGLVYLTADGQNRIARESAESLARGAISVAAEHLEKSVRDYSWWNDTVRNVIDELDLEWADDNLGVWSYKNLGFEVSLVLDLDGRPVYGTVHGVRRPAEQVLAAFGAEIEPLVEAARQGAGKAGESPAAPSAFVMFAGSPHLAAAAAIKRDKANGPGPAARGTLVFTRIFDDATLADFESRFLLAGLRFAPLDGVRQPASVELAAADGRVIGGLTWRADKPGTELLRHLGVPLAFVFAIAVALSALIILRTRVAAAALEASHLRLAEQAEALAAARDSAEAQRRIEAELRRKATAASHAKSEFLAHMSHEFRTPLNAILGFSEFILMTPLRAQADAKVCEYVGDIHQSGRHLLALINDVLDLAKIEAGKRELEEEDLDLDGCIDECLRLLRAQISDKALAIGHARSGLMLRADTRAMQQVFINLLSNAVKFTRRGGRIAIGAAWQTGGVAITIADTGCGMKPEDIERALAPFCQVETVMNRATSGTGLGLTITQHLVEMHGGILRIESELNVGTRVSVVLPASRVAPAGEAGEAVLSEGRRAAGQPIAEA